MEGEDASPTKVPRVEVVENRLPSQPGTGSESATKIQRIGTITAALEQIQDWARNGEWENRIASVLDLLDTQLDPREVEKARDVQMATLVEKEFALPRLKCEISRKSKLFHYKWVDEIKRGMYRSRFTCADIKRKYSPEELAEETNTFAPTPYEESHVLFELKCLCNGWNSRSGDVRCAYLLGKDSGDAAGNPVHIRVPPEYKQHFEAWLHQQSQEVQKKFAGVDLFKDVVLELVEIYMAVAQQATTTGRNSKKWSLKRWHAKGINSKEANATRPCTLVPGLVQLSFTTLTIYV